MSQMRTPLRAEGHRLLDAAGDQVVMTPDGEPFRHVGEDDAARIAACVNACAGLEDPGEAVAMLVTLARDLYDVWAGGGDLADLHMQIRDAAGLLPWPADACWGCGESLAAEGSVEEGCCANCARVVESPAKAEMR